VEEDASRERECVCVGMWRMLRERERESVRHVAGMRLALALIAVVWRDRM
jgi:hypothetical protein